MKYLSILLLLSAPYLFCMEKNAPNWYKTDVELEQIDRDNVKAQYISGTAHRPTQTVGKYKTTEFMTIMGGNCTSSNEAFPQQFTAMSKAIMTETSIKKSFKDRYRSLKESGMSKQEFEVFAAKDITEGMAIWNKQSSTFSEVCISKIKKSLEKAKAEILSEYPRRRPNIGEFNFIARQSLVPTQKELSSLIPMRSLPIDIFRGNERTMFDLDEGSPTLAKTIPIFISDVIHERPVDIVLDIISPEDQIILKQHEIIAEYINENNALKFTDRDSLVATGDDKLQKDLIYSLDNKYAEMIVRLKYPNLNDVEFYWAVLKEKELLLSLLRSTIKNTLL